MTGFLMAGGGGLIATSLLLPASVPMRPQTEPEPEIRVSPAVAERCQQEGGCQLVSQLYLTNLVNHALQDGFRQGVTQACQRKDL